jgi:hypothetical protein
MADAIFGNVSNLLGSNKAFLGFSSILMSMGSRFVFSDITPLQEYILKLPIVKYIILFCMCFLTTRDVRTSIVLTFSFYTIIYHLLNEKSRFNIIPTFLSNQLLKNSERVNEIKNNNKNVTLK